MPNFTIPGRGKDVSRGFTLVELLVVIAIIGVLAGLLLPVVQHSLWEAEKADCKSQLRQVAIAARSYAGENRGLFPWPRPVAGQQTDLADDADARACLELLYRHGHIDDPRLFVCRAAKTDVAADVPETAAERRAFHLEEHNSSYTWRKRITTTNDDSRTPLAADKRHGRGGITNHPHGRNVVFLGTNVEWFSADQLEALDHRDSKRAKAELIGFDRLGRD